jgi:hypothetical protein
MMELTVFGSHIGEGEASAANGLLVRFWVKPTPTGVGTGMEGLAGMRATGRATEAGTGMVVSAVLS